MPTIKYSELNHKNAVIFGDHVLWFDGILYLTHEDLKYFPKVIHLKRAHEVHRVLHGQLEGL